MNLTLSALTGHSGAGDNHLNLAVWDKATHTLTQGCSSKGDQTFIHGYSVAKSPPAAGGPLCPRVALPPGGSTEWIEVGSLLDSYSRSTPNVCCPPPPASKAGPGVFRPRHMEHAQGHVQDLARCHLYRAPATRRHKPQLPSQLLGRRDSCNFFRRECVAAAAGGCEHPRHKEGPR